MVAKDDVGAVGMKRLFFQIFPEQAGCFGPNRADPDFLAFPMQENTGRRDKVEIAGLEINDFADARAGVEQ